MFYYLYFFYYIILYYIILYYIKLHYINMEHDSHNSFFWSMEKILSFYSVYYTARIDRIW